MKIRAAAFVALAAALGAGARSARAQTLTPGAYTNVFITSVTANYSSNFGPGTVYTVQLSTTQFFTGAVLSSSTQNSFATFVNLQPSTTYYGQVSTGAAGPFVSLSSAATQAAPAASDLTVSSNQSLAPGTYFYNVLTINAGTTLTLQSSTAADAGVSIYASTITNNGTITAAGQGYPAGAGPGAGATDGTHGSGGAFGGNSPGIGAAAGAAAYGSIASPTDLGSGGGTGSAGTAAAGGGAIYLNVTNTLYNGGAIAADGASVVSGNSVGGGSGGSVWIVAGAVTGVSTATISANGGTSSNSGGGSGGGGGRIAIQAGVNSFPGAIQAQGGSGIHGNGGNGGAGTVLLFTGGAPGALTLNNGTFGAEAPTPLPSGLSLGAFTVTQCLPTVSSITATTVNLNGSSTLTVSTITAGVLNVGNSVILTYPAGSLSGLSVTASTLNVALGGQILADGLGYAGGAANAVGGGPGGGAGSGQGGGASYGGYGSTSGTAGSGGQVSYDSPFSPTSLGSGGGGGNGNAGGAGGGAIRLFVSGTLNNNFVISANGAQGGNPNGGGGSGGSIWITAGSLTGSGGRISANGASGYSGTAGAGGGGRVSITASTITYTGPITARGAINNGVAGAGTVLLRTGSEAYGDLTVDNGGNSGVLTPLPSVLTLDSLTTQNGALVSASTITLSTMSIFTPLQAQSISGFHITAASVTIQSTGWLDADGAGYAGGAANLVGSGPGAGAGGGQGGGGAYAGNGTPSNTGAAGGAGYGRFDVPNLPGSGGGGGNGNAGGAGGGVLYLNVSTLTVSGKISANGLAGGNPNGGGGSGGSVWIIAGSFIGTAGSIVSANGGNGASAFGGSGGGGRVLLQYGSYSNPSGLVEAFGGTGNGTGGAGTLALWSLSQTAPDLNIDNGAAPAAAATVVIGSGTARNVLVHDAQMVLTGTPSAASLTMIGASTVTATTVTITSVDIGAGSLLNHPAGGPGLDLTAQNLTVEAGGGIVVDGLGFAGGTPNNPGSGPGGGAGSGNGGGAGHGGNGTNSGTNGTGGTAYGSVVGPTEFGSGGGGGNTQNGGAGGGAIRLIVGGTLTVNGAISADGVQGGNPNGGGGSGGSIWISAANFVGGSSGTIFATGAGGYAGAAGNGGGGRIYISYGTLGYLGALNAAGGSGGPGVGGAGVWATQQNAEAAPAVYVLNSGAATVATPLSDGAYDTLLIQNALPSVGTITVNGLTVGGASQLTAVSITASSSVTVNAGGSIVQQPGNGAGLSITSPALTVAAGGSINADGEGYPGGGVDANGLGPGAGQGGGNAGGAGYGGPGGASNVGASGGPVYGSSTAPTGLGSGGGGGNLNAGGAGGGAVFLNVAGTLTDNGDISANGGDGVHPNGGGGSGGTIVLSAGSLVGVAGSTIAARGGAGQAGSGGGGGGGRIELAAPISGYLGAVTTAGGAGNVAGGAGTIYQATVVTASGLTLAPPLISTTNVPAPLLRFTLQTTIGLSTFTAMQLQKLGSDTSDSNVTYALWRDANGDGVFQSTDTLLSTFAYSESLITNTLTAFSVPIGTSPTTFFITVSLGSAPPTGTTYGAEIAGSGYFSGLPAPNNPAVYPIQSALTTVGAYIPALASSVQGDTSPSAGPPASGGVDSGETVSAGQAYSILASGSWSPDGVNFYGPAGTGIFSCPGCVVATAPLGSLIARVAQPGLSGGTWFYVGASSATTAAEAGDVFFGINQTPAGYASAQGALSVLAQTMPSIKTWTGAGATNNASEAANWLNGNPPLANDFVLFDGVTGAHPNKNVNWDLLNLKVGSLSLAAYGGVFTVSPPAGIGGANELEIGMLSVASGTFSLGAQAVLLDSAAAVTGGTLDMGPGGGVLDVGPGGLTLSGSGVLESIGTSPVELAATSVPWPFVAAGGTINISNTSGTQLDHLSGMNLNLTATAIPAMNNVNVTNLDYGEGATALVLTAAAPVSRSFSGWTFDASVGYDVDATGLPAGSAISFLNAGGPKFGSPNDIDPNHVLSWQPDGGGTGEIDGTAFYSGQAGGAQYVIVSTVGFIDESADMASFKLTPIGGSANYAATGLAAPATYYVFGFVDVPNAGQPAIGDPRGGFQNDGLFVSAPVFLAPNAVVAHVNFNILDQGLVTGAVASGTTQRGVVVAQAFYNNPPNLAAAPSDRETLPQGATFYTLSLPPTTSGYALAFVDVNRSGAHDLFEASGQAGPLTVHANAATSGVNLTITGGSAAPGGTVTVSGLSVGPPAIGDQDGDVAILKLSALSAGATAQLGAVAASAVGSAVSAPTAALYLDNGDGVFEPGLDTPLARAVVPPGASTLLLTPLSPAALAPGATQVFFLTLNGAGGSPGGSAQLSLSSGSFTLAAGSFSALTGATTSSTLLLFSVPANAAADVPASPDGRDTGLALNPGQVVSVSGQGAWSIGGSTAGPGGLAGKFGGMVPGAPLGALIGRVGAGAWFSIGAGAAHVVAGGETGELALAANEPATCPACYSTNSGELLAGFTVSGSSVGAIAGLLDYRGVSPGSTVTVTATNVGSRAAYLASVPIAVAPSTVGFSLAGLPPGSYTLSAVNLSTPSESGSSPLPVVVAQGQTLAAAVIVFGGQGQLAGSAAYSGTKTSGPLTVVASTSTGIDAVYLASSSVSGGNFIFSLPAPATYYLLGFSDNYARGRPANDDPVGWYGSTGAVSDLPTLMTPAFVGVNQATAPGINFSLSDVGDIYGTVTSSAPGTIVLQAFHGSPSDGAVVLERQLTVASSPGAAVNYTLSLLRPATDYSVFAFLDLNGSRTFVSGEPAAQSAAGLVVSTRTFAQANLVLAAPAPPAPAGFAGAALSGTAVKWSWNDVLQAAQFLIETSTGGVLAALPAHTTTYVDTVAGPGAASAVRQVASSNPSGQAASSSTAVCSLDNAPSGLTFSTTSATTDLVSWSANGDIGSTLFSLERATAAGGPYAVVGSTPAASLTDTGLVPGAAYFYRVRAVNGNGLFTAYSSTAAAPATAAPAAPALAGTLAYGGLQAGSIVVEAYTSSAAFANQPCAQVAACKASATLPKAAGQSFYLPVPANATYFLRAFVDAVADGQLDAGEDAGLGATAGYAVASSQVNVGTVTISVNTIPPGAPTSLSASAGVLQASLSWKAPSARADGSLPVVVAGYQIRRSTQSNAGLVAVASSVATAFIDANVVSGTTYFYQVRAFDLGSNLSGPSSLQSAAPTAGGSLSGSLTTTDTAGSGNYHIRLTTAAASTTASLADVVVSTGAWSLSGLADGTYFVRGYRDVNGDGQQDPSVEPSGSYGGLVKPYAVPMQGSPQLAGLNIPICDRIPLTPGAPAAGTLSASSCAAQDRGSGYFTQVYTFQVGAGAGSLGVGAQIQAALNASFDPFLYLLGPDGSVVAQDHLSGGTGSLIQATLSQAGLYRLEPTSNASGGTGPFTLSLTQTGGYAGQISGTLGYLGAQSGPIVVQLANTPGGTPVRSVVAASSSSYSIGNLPDGTYYVYAFMESIVQNGRPAPGEPTGVFGPSASLPTAVTISGGAASVSSADIALADPPVGSITGTLTYAGAEVGPVRVELSLNGSITASSSFTYTGGAFSQPYSLTLLAPATSYKLVAYVDQALAGTRSLLDAAAVASPVAVAAGAATGQTLALSDPGSGPSGTASISGTLGYGGSSTGTFYVALGFDAGFNSVPYFRALASSGAFTVSNIASNVNYYLAAFLDENGNGEPDAGEPLAVAPGAVLSPSTGVSLTLADPPAGSISGAIVYRGTQSGNLIVQAGAPGAATGNYLSGRTAVARSNAAGLFPFSISNLAASAQYTLSAFVDVNGTQRLAAGEPSGSAGPIAVSTPGGPSGVQLGVYDPGALAAGIAPGVIAGTITYAGAETGTLRARLFPQANLAGSPIATVAASTPLGGGKFVYEFDNVANGTYSVDAFMDTSGSGVFNKGFEAYGVVAASATVAATSFFQSPLSGTVLDPGVGAATGTASVSGAVSNLSSAASGTLRLQLVDANGNTVAQSSAALAASVPYTFLHVAPGTYTVRGFVDLGGDFLDDPGDPEGRTATGGVVVGASNLAGLNFQLCSKQAAQPLQNFSLSSASDCRLSESPAGFAKLFTFSATEGEGASIDLQSAVGGVLYIYGPDGTLVDSDSGSCGGDACLDDLVLPDAGVYVVAATMYAPALQAGPFQLSVALSGAATGSISGTLSDNGGKTGPLYVGVFSSSDVFQTGGLLAAATAQFGAYTLSGLPTNTAYYLGAFVDSGLTGLPAAGDDNGTYVDATGSPAAVTLSPGQAISGVNIAVAPYGALAASLTPVAGTVALGGPAPAGGQTVYIEFWGNPSFSGAALAVRRLPYGPGAFDVAVATGAYYVRAWLDVPGTGALQQGDPYGVYTAGGAGASELFVGTSPASGLNITLAVPAAALSSASVSPSTATEGTASSFAFDMTIGSGGLGAGGSIAINLPAGWGTVAASTLTFTSASTASFTLQNLAGRSVAALSGGGLNPGDTVQFTLTGLTVPCGVGVSSFAVVSAQNGASAPAKTPLGSTAISVSAGAARTITVPAGLLALAAGSPTGFAVQAQDACGQAAGVAVSTTVVLSGEDPNGAGGYAYDASLLFSTSAVAASTSPLTLAFSAGQSSASVFATALSTTPQAVELAYALSGSQTFFDPVTVLSAPAVSAVNVSTGAFATNASSATIYPGSSALPQTAYVNFQLPTPSLSWMVLVSSVPLRPGEPPASVFTTAGLGSPSPGQIAWNGRTSSGLIQPPGTYFVRVQAGGVSNDSLSINLVAPQLSGTVADGGTLPPTPLPSAALSLSASSGYGALAQADSSGRFSLPVPANSTVTVTASVPGYVSLTTSVAVGVADASLPLSLTRAANVAVTASLAAGSTQAAALSGSLQCSFGGLSLPLHVAPGTTTVDDGGQWDPGLRQIVTDTVFNFAIPAGSTVTFIGSFPGAPLAASSATVFVGASGASVALPVFTRLANLAGAVSLATASVSGTTVTVTASLDAQSLAAQAYVPPGASSAAYIVAGLSPGTWQVNASAPSFAPASASAVVGGSDVALNLGPLSAGGSISGTLTIQGNSVYAGSALATLTAFGPVGASGSQAVGSAPAASTAAYSLRGLLPGATYQLYVGLDKNLAGLPALAGLSPLFAQPLAVFVPSGGPQTATVNLTFAPSSGVVQGTLALPSSPAPNFHQVSLTAQISQAANPALAGLTVLASTDATLLPGFAVVNSTTAVFSLGGLGTELLSLTAQYAATGLSQSQSVSVLSGSTSTVAFALTAPTFTISGSIVDRVADPRFDTDALLVQNAGFYAPPGWPSISSTTARVEAIARTFADYTQPVSTSTFDPLHESVGFVASAGSWSVTGLPAGIYVVRTPNLLDSGGHLVAPGQSQVVTITNANVSGLSFSLAGGFGAAGTVSLASGIQDVLTLGLTVTDQTGAVVYSGTLALGSPGAPAGSAAFSVPSLPPGRFYQLTVTDQGSPARYSAAPVGFPDPAAAPQGLQTGQTGLSVTLAPAARITAKLRDANSGQLITQANAGLLAPSFSCYAQADPWVAGGFVSAAPGVGGRPVQADGTVSVGPVVPGTSYDFICQQTGYDLGLAALGSLNYAPIRVSGIVPSGGGQTVGLGVLNLQTGQAFTGVVTSSAGTPLANIPIEAAPVNAPLPFTVRTNTLADGTYALWVSSFASAVYDVTAAPRDAITSAASPAAAYPAQTVTVNLASQSSANFVLVPLTAAVTGQLVTADAGPLSYPFGSQQGFPAGGVFLEPSGEVPVDNPLGDISAVTAADGTFSILGLSTGTYTLRAASLGYEVYVATVTLTTGTFSAGVITLQRGATVTGKILVPTSGSGYSAPAAGQIVEIAAADAGFTEFALGTLATDPISNTITRYTITGFKPGIVYDIGLIPNEGTTVFPPEGQGLSFSAAESTGSKSVNLTFAPAQSECAAEQTLQNDGSIAFEISCQRPLRDQLPSDTQVNSLVTISSVASDGTSNTSFSSDTLSGLALADDLKHITGVHPAVAGESRFSLHLRAVDSAANPFTGQNFTIDQVFDFYTGLNSSSLGSFQNMVNQCLQLTGQASGEASQVVDSQVCVPPGAFLVTGSTVSSPTTSLQLGLQEGDTPATASIASAAGGRTASAAKLAIIGNTANFPAEMAAAMRALQSRPRFKGYSTEAASTISTVQPLSAFYNIFLPAGINHLLAQKARITLAYNASASSSTSLTNLNVWFYNPATNTFELEDANRTIDTINNTISVDVSHFSTFLVLGSTPIATSTTPFTGGALTAYNFPNPFNLDPKTRQINSSPGSGQFTSGASISFRGTLIRLGLPQGADSTGEIRIYDAAAERVRTIQLSSLVGGSYAYFEWDGRNDAGRDVASGIYIAEVKVGSAKAIFKMVLIKDSRYQ